MPELLKATEAWRQSFGARMTAANNLLESAVKDVTLEQANHKERDGVLSIAFSLAHVVGGQDRNVARLLDKGPMLWESGGWAARVGYAGVMPERGTPMSVAEILEGLRANGYRYPAADPKKNLGARIYRLKGVKQVGPGRFAAE